jgi:phospholipase/lecithinase/hemolysin
MTSISTRLGDIIKDVTGSGSSNTPAPPGAPYSTIYAFGDSLSDAGNDYKLTLGKLPVSPPYSDGRFTNGPVWVQDLATDLGLPAPKPSLGGGTDFAYGGAYTGTVPGHTANPSDLNYQLTQFQAEDPHPAANALYTVWIGSNDVLGSLGQSNPVASVDAAVSNEMQFISGLASEGAQNLLVLDVPDIGKTPDAMAKGDAQTASNLSVQYDMLLQQQLQTFEAGHPQVHLTTVDIKGLLDEVAGNPSAFGFTNTTTPLWSGNLTDPHSGTLATTDPQAQAGYLFFDNLHPTAQADVVLANAIAHQLTTPVA